MRQRRCDRPDYRHVLTEHTRKKLFVEILRVAGVLT